MSERADGERVPDLVQDDAFHGAGKPRRRVVLIEDDLADDQQRRRLVPDTAEGNCECAAPTVYLRLPGGNPQAP